MKDLSTVYMGLNLKNPIVPSSSPLMKDINNVKQMEDSGAAAVIMDSLFEEQIEYEAEKLHYFLEKGTERFAESLTYFPSGQDFYSGPELYLERIKKLKESVDIPVIASLNGRNAGGWTEYAKLIEEAGADGIELNIYFLETSPDVSPREIEKRYVEILKSVKSNITIPVAVKIGPYFSSIAYTVKQLCEAGADAIVLFNRFYQPDINIDSLEISPRLVLSNPSELRLPLRWVSILRNQIKSSIAITSGIHSHTEVIKSILAGADAVQMTSVLLKMGIKEIENILGRLAHWMDEHEYDSIQSMKGSLSQESSPDSSAFERANYMKTLKDYKSVD